MSKYLAAWSLCLWVFACQTATTERARSADGVPIAYEVRGTGETTLVFVHGWACDGSFWHEQLDEFAEDFRVVSLDLGGHGASGADRDRWTLRSLGQDVQAVADALALDRFILVGHSMGGPVSLEAARLMPERVSGILCVDTLHDAELEAPEFTADQLMEGLRADFPGAMAAIVESGFEPDAEVAVVAFVRHKAVAANPDVAIPLIQELLDLDLRQALSAVNVPIRCINSAYGLPTAIDTNRKYADFDAVTLDAGGHFQHLESPERFNAEMRKLLVELQ
jgi:pimeloyl-ACP methyl ester carboxylesterase